MFTQTPTSTKSRFKALEYRAVPHVVSPGQQARAAILAPTVKAIKPGIYLIGGKHYVDLWQNLCTCREHRVQKVQPCRHRLALWLAEGIDLDDPNPVKYLQGSGVEQPEIIAWYATIRLYTTAGPRSCVARWLGGESWQCLDSGEIVSRSAEELFYLTPFYE